MGLSKVVAVNATLLLSLTFAFRKSAPPFLLLPALHASLVGIIVAASSHPFLNRPLLFCKSSDGFFPWWSVLVFSPYIFPTRAYALMRRTKTDEPVYSKVAEGLYVGGWPVYSEDVPPGQPAIVDCTCELPRSASVRHLPYLCIPIWDSRAPRPEDIELAVRWATGKRNQNRPVFIHCAFGHGRSVAIMCALLVSLGLAENWKDAEKMIRNCRPCIRMNALQTGSLKKWSMQLISKTKTLDSVRPT